MGARVKGGTNILTNYYERFAFEYYQQTVNIDLSDLYPPFLNCIPRGGEILDAGCGSGRDTLAFLKRGYRVEAIDTCLSLCQLSSKLTGQTTQHLRIQDLSWRDRFDGIWACASLLHTPQAELLTVCDRAIAVLKVGGVWYMSFKLGLGVETIDGRLFNYQNYQSLSQLLSPYPLELICHWETLDLRQRDLKWINILVRKVEPS